MFSGTMTAMVTPFRDGAIDWDRLKQNVERQVEAGVEGVVPCGTTGESPTLSHEEHRDVIARTVEYAGGRLRVIAGTGSNSTAEAKALTAFAKQAGADGALLVNPYYNKPTQEGLYRHFMAIADAVDLPLVLYNIPGRTAVKLEAMTVARLAASDRIVAIKATGSLDMASEIAMLCDLTILSGDDSLTLPLMSIGGKGVISVVSNLIPDRVKAMVDAAAAGDFAAARKKHAELFPLFKGCLALSTNPIPIKTAMAIAGLDTGELRLPLCPLGETGYRQVVTLLSKHGLAEE